MAFGFLFLIFLFGFREACQKDSLNLGERLVDGRSGEALAGSWVTQIPEGNGIGNRGFEGRGRAHGWCGMLTRTKPSRAGRRAGGQLGLGGASRVVPGPSDVKPRK